MEEPGGRTVQTFSVVIINIKIKIVFINKIKKKIIIINKI